MSSDQKALIILTNNKDHRADTPNTSHKPIYSKAAIDIKKFHRLKIL